MGSDLTVVNAARVSFDRESDWLHAAGPRELSGKDKRLIRFLARGCESGEWEAHINELSDTHDPAECGEILKWAKRLPEHWTPFAHTAITLREHVPVPVARQRFKHKVGFVENEVSRRYVDDAPTFAELTWRRRAANKKQGSAEDFDPVSQAMLNDEYEAATADALRRYRLFLDHGVCPEQARFLLPQAMMTTYWATGSLYAFAQAYVKRSDSHAQKEIQLLAAEWDRIIRPLFPVSWAALVD
ncbi:putative alternative thymidylate synthase [Azorhizobium caulinodans ORS 571]|uniref:Putative alternative thymidylate synthase n=2 Tax=Azorhizobium caulinodans TaxID=7 RepID=A8IFA3_AZOC5|nr:putative alternative thymidylate synthase [Azorhizobium caulinodans ORS 571]